MTAPQLQQALSYEQAQDCFIDPSRPETADEIEQELLDSRLGVALVELLRLAEDIDHKAACRHADAMLNGRQKYHRLSPEEKAAARLLNDLGSPDDCWFLRALAESIAE